MVCHHTYRISATHDIFLGMTLDTDLPAAVVPSCKRAWKHACVGQAVVLSAL